MKKRFTRMAAIFFAAALILGCCAFCGKNETTTTAAQAGASDTQALYAGENETSASQAQAAPTIVYHNANTSTDADDLTLTDTTDLAGALSSDEASDKVTEANKNTTQPETTQPETTQPETTQPETTANSTDNSAAYAEGYNTAMGITAVNNTRGTYFGLAEVATLAGSCVYQDGSWEWIDASDTTPQRGDIVVYHNGGGYATHVAVCVTSYGYCDNDGNVKYRCVDGNYGPEPGTVYLGYKFDNSPNKGWPDSYVYEAPGVEQGLGVWRSSAYGEQMACAAEAAYYECVSIGQMAFLEKYIPEGVYGGWCYYMIPICVNKVARGEV